MFPGPRFAANWTFPGGRSWSCLSPCLVPVSLPWPVSTHEPVSGLYLSVS